MEWLLEYWLQVIFGIIVGLLTWLVKRQYSRQVAIEKGIQALLRDRIVFSHYKYIERGYISLHGLEAIENMYKEYHNLGGNGAVTRLMKDIRNLEVVEDLRGDLEC